MNKDVLTAAVACYSEGFFADKGSYEKDLSDRRERKAFYQA